MNSRPLDDRAFARVKQAHLEHGVLVFRDQHLTPEEPQILLVSNDRHPDGRPVGIADAGRYWHTDMSYMAREPRHAPRD